MRILDREAKQNTADELGFYGKNLEVYNELVENTQGVILVVGPTGSGKSSTLFTMINKLNTEEVNIITLEDPVEYNVTGVNQVQVNEKTGMTFASGLRSILRQDPDIVSVGEIRDDETAEIAMRSAITGHVVISTIHTNDAVGTIERLEDIGVEPYLVSSALRGVISQRLVRRICPRCRTAYTPDEDELADLGLPNEEGVQFYKGAGCPECFDTGYRGRIAVFEMLIITGRVRRMIAEGASRGEIEAELKKPESGFVSLRENALRLVREGITTSSELLRVISEDD
jgi:type IV pilus assembly protein PilB